MVEACSSRGETKTAHQATYTCATPKATDTSTGCCWLLAAAAHPGDRPVASDLEPHQKRCSAYHSSPARHKLWIIPGSPSQPQRVCMTVADVGQITVTVSPRFALSKLDGCLTSTHL